ncbi:DNA polymerase III subunit delta' [Tardibacter chloracetimidivorans]|uniref:DNA polymerase III subunit delta n=1 Tax=Tardibacter chloracetimidivorans TaxID=1921510 RepID=A0A1L3ZR80_9SPHN|nr:DNA polymerase III subunit delta' [Tardibacter chloracetimidivorans]API58137.1 DNA polymerase III subunit delta' [Tardibacter chloracetimidivorans]
MSLIGHQEQAEPFLEAWRSGRMPHAWLLAGPQGLGKRRFADAAARHVLASAAGPAVDESRLDVPDSHPTAHLIEAGSHMDMRVLEREVRERTGDRAAGISIDQVRALQPLLQSTPALSPWRAIIVDSIDDLARAAANALLKSLEEPPPATIFLLVSHAPGRLLPTIRSRCRMMRFQPLPDDQIRQVIAMERPDISETELAALLRIAEGVPGKALRYAGLDIAGLAGAIATIEGKGQAAAAAQTALSRSLSLKAAQPRYEAFLELVPAHIAQRARTLTGQPLARALSLWEKARDLAASAVPLSLDPQSVVFELAGLLAALDKSSEPEAARYG